MADAKIILDLDATAARRKYEQTIRDFSSRPVNVPLAIGGQQVVGGGGFVSGSIGGAGLTLGSGLTVPQAVASVGGVDGGPAGNASVVAAAGAAITPPAGRRTGGTSFAAPAYSGGEQTGRGLFSYGNPAYAAAARFIAPAAITTSVLELARLQAGQRGQDYQTASAGSYRQYIGAEVAGVRNLTSGPIGSLYGLYADTFTDHGPSDAIQKFEYAGRAFDLGREIRGYNRERASAAAERYAYRTGGSSGERRQSVVSRTTDAQGDLDDQIEEQRDLQSRVRVGRSGADNREYDLREHRIELLNARRDALDDRRNAELAKLDDERALDRQRLGVRGAEARNFGLSETEQARRSLGYRQALEYSNQRRTDRALLPALEVEQDAETDRFERQVVREDRFANFGSASSAAQSRYRAANDPFSASLRGILDGGATAVARADPSHRAGIETETLARAGELAAQSYRQFAAQQQSIGTQQAVTARLLARDPLGAQLEAIRGSTNAQILGADSLPFGVRQATQYGIRQVGQSQQALARQQYSDQVLESRAALEFSNESLRIQTDNPNGSSYGERARRAETNDIVRQTQLARLRAVNDGRSDLLPGLQERGRLQLRDQSQRYLDSFNASEGDARRLAGGTGSAQRVLDDIAKAADQLRNPANPGGADKPITAEDMKRIMEDAVEKLGRAS